MSEGALPPLQEWIKLNPSQGIAMRMVPPVSGMVVNTNLLHKMARNACERIKPGLNDGDRDDAVLTSIVFSAFSLESFINELPSLIELQFDTVPDILNSLSRILSEAEKSRASIEIKYLWSSIVLFGKAYDKGSHPFQDFQLLIDLRNYIAHFKPIDILKIDSTRGPVFEDRKIVSRLKRKDLLSEHDIDKSGLVGLITDRKMAVWACNSAQAMIASVVSMLPNEFREHIKPLFEEIKEVT